jgi:PAS domain S-box-containing protein
VSAVLAGDRGPTPSGRGVRRAAVALVTGRNGVWLLTAVMAALTAVTFVTLIAPRQPYEPGDELAWPIFAGAFFIAEAANVRVRIRHQPVTVWFSVIPLVVGFYYQEPGHLVIALLVGSGLAVSLQRERSPLWHSVNLVGNALSCSIGLLVFLEIAGAGPATLTRWVLASVAGSVTAIMLGAVARSLATSALRRRIHGAELRRAVQFGLLTAAVNSSLALVVVLFLHAEPDEVYEGWLLAVPVAVGLIGYRVVNALRERKARLEFLYDCSWILRDSAREEATLGRLLQRTTSMFDRGPVELMLSGHGPAVTRAFIDDRSGPRIETVAGDMLTARRSLLGAAGTGRRIEHPSGDVPGLPGERELMIVPLRANGDIVGTLLVADHPDDIDPFGVEDLRALETLGSRIGLNLETAGLLDRLASSLDDVSKLAAIVQSSEDAILACDADGRITTWNAAAIRLLDYPPEAIIGRAASDVVRGIGQPGLCDSLAAVLEGASVGNLRTEWRRRDGAAVWLSVTISPILSSSGEISGASAILHDESDRVRAEKAAAASAEQLRIVIESSPLGMGISGQDHRWIEANPALCALLGRPVDETVGRPVTEMIHPDDMATIGQLEERLFSGGPELNTVERRYVCRDGRVVWAQVTTRVIVNPPSGGPVALYTIEDITERRRADEQARSTEEQFRRAALAISAIQDPSRVIRATLTAARETLRAEYAVIATYGDDGSELVDMQADGISADVIRERLAGWPAESGVLALARRLGRPIRLRDLRAHPEFGGLPEGHPPLTSFMAVPLSKDRPGRATLYVGNKLDAEEFSNGDEAIAVALATHAAVCLENAQVSARARELVLELDRANTELTAANEAKSRFLASVAHELRTPLHAIVVAGELVHDPPAGSLSESQIRNLGGTIESSGRHMVRLIDDLVDLARIEAGRLDLRPTQVALGDMLEEIASDLTSAVKERKIVLELPDGHGPTVVADPVRLRQILTNLLVNAVKFTEPGGRVWVEVSTTRASIRITVHDTGIGIAAPDLERAFVPFEQVSRTSTAGAGLGLSIARSLAELHGGELHAVSELGSGSAFTLTLPRHPAGGTPQPATRTNELPAPFDGEGRPILVVEDDPTAIGLVADVLRMADYEVWQAKSMHEANLVLDQAVPALILLDVRLPDGSGLDLATRIRSDERLGSVPILALSADTTPDDVRRAREAGCTEFLPKPLSPRMLLARIHEALGVGGPTPTPS